MKKIFVYGTLKKGFSNSHILYNSKFLGKKTLKGFALWKLICSKPICQCGIPVIVPNENYSVKGELYLVDDYVFNQIDSMEKRFFYTLGQKGDWNFWYWDTTIFENLSEICRLKLIKSGIW